ncbi:MAG: SulP family inorganic anion transporter [Chitinophagales bacterium]
MNQSSKFSTLLADIPSSIVVFLVALPLCLGIALGSGAPLFSGIIAGIAGGIVVGLLSGSQLSVSGPAAGLTVIVAAAISSLPTYEVFLLSVVLAGALQCVFGAIKAGVIGDYIPSSVIKGMLAAIGLILIFKQLPHLVGFDADFEGDETFLQPDGNNTFSELANAFGFLTPGAVLIGAMALAIQFIWDRDIIKKIKPLAAVPAPLIVVALGTAMAWAFRQHYPALAIDAAHYVKLPVSDSLKSFAGFFTFPDFSAIANKEMLIAAFTIAVVASLESLLSVEAADKLDTYKRVTPGNRELMAQGAGNMVSGMLGGLPVTAVIVRTAANINAGAKSKMSTIIHGCLLLICVYAIPGWLNKIPLSALAGILIFAGFKLTKPALFASLFKKGWNQFLPFVITIAAILFTDLLIGILIGMMAALFFMIKSSYNTSVLLVQNENNFLLRFRKDVSYLNKPLVKSKLEGVPNNSALLIDATRADFIDSDIVEVVNDFVEHAGLKNIRVEFKTTPEGKTKFEN